jgi:hypothetical protein
VSELNITVRQAVKEGYRRLGIPADYHLPRRGLFRVAFALHLVYGDLLELDGGSFNLQLIADIGQRPFGNDDPVAAAISSLIIEDDLPREGAVLRELLRRKTLLRQRNISLIEAVVQQTAALAISLGYFGETRIRKSAELARFRTYRLCLDATECYGKTRDQILETARKNIEPAARLLGDLSLRKVPLFWANWLCTDIKRRPPWNLFSWLLGLDHLSSSSEVHEHLRRAAREEKQRDPEDEMVSELTRPEVREIERFYGRKSYCSALRLASLAFPGLCTSPLGLPESVVLEILQKCTVEDGPGACYIAFSCAALAGRAALRTLEFHESVGGLISTRIYAPQQRSRVVHELLRPSSNRFFRYLPETLCQRFQHFWRQLGLKQLVKHAQAWLKANWAEHRPTVRKLERALLTNGPDWFGYDWIYAYYSIEGTRRKGHAAKSYCQISQPIRRRADNYLRAFFDFQPTANAAELPPFGSSLVPTDETIRAILRRLPELVRADIPNTPEHLLGNLTILAALAHFTLLLFCGLRNNPMQPLPLRHLNRAADWELVYQKTAPFVLYVPAVVRNVFGRARVQTEGCLDKLRSLGFAVDPNWDFVIYGFPEVRTDGSTITRSAASHKKIIGGLIADPGLSKFAVIPRTAGRQWSNTVLRESGEFTETEIRTFFGHHDTVFHPSRKTRLEVLVNRELRERVADFLASRAGCKEWCTST